MCKTSPETLSIGVETGSIVRGVGKYPQKRDSLLHPLIEPSMHFHHKP